MSVTMKIVGLEKLDRLFANLSPQLWAGVKVVGAPAAWALVWEFGSVRITKPGPKTVWGQNPKGDRVVLTITAPYGYIRIHKFEYIQILKEEIANAHLSRIKTDDWENAIKNALTRAEIRCGLLIIESAPIDTGQLQHSIQPAGINSAIVLEGTLNSYGPTQFELGTDWV